MIQLVIFYGYPQDEAAFDRYYLETHIPLARKLPGLKGYTYSKLSALDQQTQPSVYMLVQMYFEDQNALQAARQSPEGQVAAGDLPNFATGGVTLFVAEAQEVHLG